MAQLAGAELSYTHRNTGSTGGNCEDLSDIIYDVSPTETPFITLIGKGSAATGVHHEWLTDELNAPYNNSVPEAHIAEPKRANPRSRIGNYTQILEKTASVSGTQEKVDKAGVKSEMAYQVARRMKELKRDLELILVGKAPAVTAANSPTGTALAALPQIASAGSDVDARKMASFVTFMDKDSYFGAASGVTLPTGDGKTLPIGGALRNFDDSVLTSALQKMWENGTVENMQAIMGSTIRGKFSKLQGTSTRYVSTDSARLQASIDVYDGDFHTITATPDRYSDKESIFLVDPAMASLDDLRPIFSQDLAVTGDGMSKQIIWETTLKVNNPKSHGVIASLQ